MRKVWNDPIERRAALLSITLHLVLGLFLLVLSLRPAPEPPLPIIVLDLGPPQQAIEEVIAATGEEDAPSAPMTEIEADEIGTATAQVAEQQEAQSDDSTAVSASPPEVAAPTPPELPATAPSPTFDTPASVQTEMSEPDPLPEPQQTVELPEIAPPDPTSMPQLATVEITPPEVTSDPVSQRTLTDPTVEASAPAAQALGDPAAEATFLEGRTLASPGVSIEEIGEHPLTSEHVTADAISERPLSGTGVSVDAVTSQPLVATASEVSSLTTRAVPQPNVVATVRMDEAAAGAPIENVEGTPGSSTVESSVVADSPPGGTGSQAGQVGESESDDGRGAAASPDGEPGATGGSASTISFSPYSQTRQSPYAVLLDNLGGYPQSGLREATAIIEAPVEGFITRLMAFYDQENPVRVGPVRSARDYFVDLAAASGAVLVHDGGSPAALAQIDASTMTSFNAYREGQLFARDSSGFAPYNLYTRGDEVRQLIESRLSPNPRPVSTATFRPEGFRAVNEMSVPFTGTYRTGFRYEPGIGRYRWIRNGDAAVHPDGQPMLTDVVLLIHAEARPLPGDSEGRLFMSLQSGPAVLYIDGQALDGRWELNQTGITPPVQFRAETGEILPLAPYKSWIIFAPSSAFERRVEISGE